MGVQQPSDCVPLRPIRSTQTDCDAVGTLRCAPCPPGFIASLFAHDTEQTAAAFPCVSSIRPSKSTSGLSPRNAPSAAWTTSPPRHPPPPQAPADYAGLDCAATAAPRPPHQCRAVIARSVGDPFASDDPQPRQRLLRTRAPAEASLLRTDAAVLCIATSAANLRPQPSAASRHTSPQRASRTRARHRHRRFSRDIAASWSGGSYRCETPAFLVVSATLPRHKPLTALTLKRHNARAFGICTARRLICRQVLPRFWVAALTYYAKIIPKTAEAIRRLGGQCSGTLGGIIPPNPHFAPTFTCYLPENQHTAGLPTD